MKAGANNKGKPFLLSPIAAAVVLSISSSEPAQATTCTGTNTTSIVCVPTGLSTPNISSSLNNANVTINSGSQITNLLGIGTPLVLSGNNTVTNNAGTIDPSLLGLLSALSSGAVVGNANASTQTFNNSGTIYGTSGLINVNLSSLTGLALTVRNGAGGVSYINNSGYLGSKGLLGITLLAGDAPVLATYGGAQANIVNTGTIAGRMAMQSSAPGNTFVNAGTINGSLWMGAGSTNTFTAVTGSTVNPGNSSSTSILGLAGLNLSFVEPGIVDGGANGDNTLIAQNSASGTGTGVTGNGVISSSTYRNFNRLRVNSGTWTLGSLPGLGYTSLDGGQVIVNSADALGSNLLTANGGALQAGVAGLNMSVPVSLASGGLTVNGSNDFSLNGAIGGTGRLYKYEGSTLTLNGNNTYSGGTLLSGGGLVLGSATALGSGALTVGNASTLDTISPFSLGNAVILNNNLSLSGSQSLALTGAISGTGELIKNGAATLTLAGNNSYSGGTILNAGNLTLGSDTALGTGVLTVNGAGLVLGTTQALGNVANQVLLNNTLTLGGPQSLTLSGSVAGYGGLIKTGEGTATLSGNNSYLGDTTLAAGRLVVGSNNALGTGNLLVTGPASLGATSSQALNNGITLSNLLTVEGGNLTVNGLIQGTGALAHRGSGSLLLTNANTYTGGTVLNSGNLVLGNDAALGSGAVSITGAAILDNNRNTTLSNAFQIGAPLTFAGSHDLTLNGALSGSGSLVKEGNATLTLNGANSFSGITQLAGGTLDLGNNAALGTGALEVTGSSRLAANILELNLSNAIGLGAQLEVLPQAGQSVVLGGAINGLGSLLKSGSGVLRLDGFNAYSGGTTLSAGTLVLGDNLALGSGRLVVSGPAILDADSAVTAANTITLNDALTVAGSQDLTLLGTINGTGSLVKSGAANLTLQGQNSYSGGTTVNAGTLTVNSGSLLGAVTNNALLAFNQDFDGTFSGSVTGLGGITKSGTGVLTLSGTNSFTGGLDVRGGSVALQGGNALADDNAVTLEAGTSLLVLNSETLGALRGAGSVTLASGVTLTAGGDNANAAFAGTLTGAGGLSKLGSGVLRLAGNNTYTGTTTIDGGVLGIDGSLASTSVVVANGGSLTGTGSITGDVAVQNGGSLGNTSGQTLSVGSLVLDAGSSLNFALGQPLANPQALVNVNGNLTLDGTLNVTDAGGFGRGLYRLFNYSGSLTDNGLAIGNYPSTLQNSVLSVATGIQGQINLLVSSATGGTQFWTQGSGSWGDGIASWSNDLTGTSLQNWESGNYGIFSGPGGTVTLNGTQVTSGLQFFNDGYLLSGGSLIAANTAETGNILSIRVSPQAAATIDSLISGTGSLNKRDLGTLILSAGNTYSGGTVLSEGVLQVSDDSALGDVGGALTFNGGTLRITGTGFSSTARTITWGSNGGGLDITDPAHVFTLGQSLSGNGGLTKWGSGTLNLTGDNTYTGATVLAAGTLLVGSDTALGSGPLVTTGSANLAGSGNRTLANSVSVSNGTTLGLLTSDTLTLTGLISGAGTISKQGAGELILTRDNTLAGNMALNAGTLTLGGNNSLGTSLLTVAGTSRLGSINNASLSLNNSIALNGALSVADAYDLTLGGAITGGASGSLVKSGAGTLSLTGGNSYSGTTVLNSGILLAGSDSALGTSVLSVQGSAALGTLGPRLLANSIDLAPSTTLETLVSESLTLSGLITGVGSLTKTGTGLLTLANANTYSGGTSLSAGALQLANDAALGTGTLNVTGNSSVSTDTDRTVANNIALGDALTLSLPGTQALNLSGVISGGGTLVKDGNATLTLSGAAPNTFSGGIQLNGGTLVADKEGALGTGVLNVANTAILAADNVQGFNNTISLGRDATLNVSTGTALTLGGSISGAGRLATVAAGTLSLTGINSYSGGTSLSGGTLSIGNDSALGSGAVSINGATNLQVENTTGATLNNAIVLNNTLSLRGLYALTLNGEVSGAGTLIKNGAATLTLSGDNSNFNGITFNQGRIVANTDTALGTGALTVNASTSAGAETVLVTNGARTIGNDVVLNSAGSYLSLLTNNNVTLNGLISGIGVLQKAGAGSLVVNGANTYSGGTELNAGTLILGNDLALGSGALTVTGTSNLDASGIRTLANAIELGDDLSLTIDGTNSLTLSGVLSGNGALIKNGQQDLILTAANTYTGGTQLNVGNLIGSTGSLQGNIAAAAGTQLEFRQDTDGSYSGALSGAGNVLKSGAGVVSLSNTASSTLSGNFDILGGTLSAQVTGLLDSANRVAVASGATLGIGASQSVQRLEGLGSVAIDGAAVLNIGAAGTNNIFAGDITGAGTLEKTGAGDLALTGSNTHTGLTNINTGSLTVDGTLSSATVNVNGGGTLQGIGTLTGAVNVNNGGLLSASSSRGTLTVADLNLNSGSVLDFTLGAPDASSLVDVRGALSLNGATVNARNINGAFGLGLYRLFTYNSLAGTDLSLAASLDPNTYSLSYSLGNTINLVVQDPNSPNSLLYWNGPTTTFTAGDQIVGGSGVWSTLGTNWVNTAATDELAWNGRYAVFSSQATDANGNLLPSTVEIDGIQDFTGLEFLTDGYQLTDSNATPGELNIAGARGEIWVDPSATTVIDTNITGAGALDKTDGGTLILGGNNTYAGGTTFSGGVTQVDSEARLGSGGLTFAGGILRIVGTSYNGTGKSVLLDGNGTFDIADPANQFEVSSLISGPGSLAKAGTGTLLLSGANSYTGETTLTAGTLLVGNNAALGTGALTVTSGALDAAANSVSLSNAITLNGVLTLPSSSELTLVGAVTGLGGLIKNGVGTLTLNGANSYSGATDFNSGTLVLGNDTALGTGTLWASNGTVLNNTRALTLRNQIELEGNLTLPGEQDLTLNGVIADGGSLTKNGPATLTLNGNNAYAGGTALNGGTLVLGSNTALGTGALTVANGAVVTTNAPLVLSNAIQSSGTTTVAVSGGNDLTLNGAISGTGALIKSGDAILTLNGNNAYSGGTTLNAGTLVVGNNNALGSGALSTTGGTRLDTNQPVTLANAVNLSGALDVLGSNDLTLTGPVTGPGSLLKTGPALLTLLGSNTYSGGTQLAAGGLVVGSNTALGTGSVSVNGSSSLDSAAAGTTLDNNFTLNDTLTFTASNSLTLSGSVSGNGGLVKNGGATLTLAGTNTYGGGTIVNAGTLAGNSLSLQGVIDTAVGSVIEFIQGADLPSSSTSFTGTITGDGGMVKSGTGVLVLSGSNSYTGGTTINAGTLVGNTTTLQGDISIGGSGTLVFDQSTNGTYSGNLTGSGDLVKDRAGSLTLTGNSSFTGSTLINEGTLLVEGTLNSSDVAIGQAASLGGSGTINSNISLSSGSRLVAGSYLTPLTFNGSLNLASGSQFDVLLGAPNDPTTLVNVRDNLTLDGTLNISDAGGLGTGVYRLFSYGGQLLGGGLSFGNLPVGFGASSFNLQTSLANQVNLLVTGSAGTIQFWNGSAGSNGDGTISGGSGVWSDQSLNWTDATATAPLRWNAQYAAFGGTGGTVTVDGSQAFTGMQFLTNGYALEGGVLQALGTTEESAIIRVDQGVSTVIGSQISGNSGIAKRGAGTLILTADNSYTGGTAIRNGTLQVGQDSALGAPDSLLTLDGGILRVTGTTFASTPRSVVLGSNGGGIDIVESALRFTLSQALEGTGSLTKNGAGTLLLTGNNSYSGATQVNQGTLAGSTASLQGNIGTAPGSVVLFDQAESGTYTGILSGAGTLLKTGNGVVTLTGSNTYSGGTTVQDGAIQISQDTNLGVSQGGLTLDGGELQVAGTALTTTSRAVTLGSRGGAFNIIERSARFTLNQALGGSGGLTKTGAGTLVLAANTTYTGGTQVNAGALAGNSASLQGSIQTAPETQVLFEQNSTGAFTGTLGGAGSLIKTGGGLLALASDNTHAGGTFIQGGTLEVDRDTRLGAAAGALTLDGGALRVAGTEFTGTERALTLGANGGGFDIVERSLVFTVSQALGGTGGLTKNGAGTLVLTGANSYSGGTVLNEGALQGTSNSLSGAIAAAGGSQVIFDQDFSGTYAGALSGAGTLLKTGSGSLTLGGVNTYTGGTTVAQGALIGTTSSLQGNVINNATVILAQDSIGTFNGLFSGNGTLTKQGAGIVTLLGNHSFSGDIQVNEGGLLVGNGSSALDRIDARIKVGADASFGGTGQVDSLDNSGVVALGNTGSALGVSNTYINRTNGLLRLLAVRPSGPSLRVGGAAELGGTLEVLDGIVYQGEATRYNVLAANSISGTFEQTRLPQFAFLNTVVDYGDRSVDLVVSRNSTAFSDVATSPNQAAVATAVEQGGPSEVAAAVTGLDVPSAQAAFDQLSGEATASLTTAMRAEASQVRQAISARLRQSCTPSASQDCSINNPLPLMPLALSATDGLPSYSTTWAYALGGWGTSDGQGGSASQKRSVTGMMFGADRPVDQNWRVGVAAGYSDASMNVDDRNSRTNSKSVHLSGYARYQQDAFSLRMGLAHSWQDVKSNRSVSFPGFQDRLKADYDANTSQAFAEVGYFMDLSSVNLEPYLNLTHTRFKTDTIHEKGGPARLTSEVDERSTATTVGIRAARHLELQKSLDIVIRGGLGWQHDFSSTPKADMAFSETNSAFNAQGSPVARDSAIVEAGAEINLSTNHSLQFNYGGQLSSDSRDHEMRMNYTYRF